MPQRYEDPIIKKYIDLIRSKTSVFKVYYQGDPLQVPASEKPVCIISKRDTIASTFNNAQDEHLVALSITVITDIRKEFSTAEDIQKAVAGIASLYDIMEGRTSTYALKTTSILGILRGNINVDLANNLRTDLSTVTRVDYGTTQRGEGEWSIEARVDFVAHFVQTR